MSDQNPSVRDKLSLTWSDLREAHCQFQLLEETAPAYRIKLLELGYALDNYRLVVEQLQLKLWPSNNSSNIE